MQTPCGDAKTPETDYYMCTRGDSNLNSIDSNHSDIWDMASAAWLNLPGCRSNFL